MGEGASEFVFPPPPRPAVQVAGGGMFPVRRIFCVGKNYADHVREMGGDPSRTPPVFFTKPADALVASGGAAPYPPATADLHYEGELVLALAGGGRDIAPAKAAALVFGYAAGCDLTRRDLQAKAKSAGAPWDAAKAFDHSAAVGDILRRDDFGDIAAARLALSVNGELRQQASLAEMIWSAPEIIAHLSALFELKAGDLIFTGTPSGVGPLSRGDLIRVEAGRAPALSFSIG